MTAKRTAPKRGKATVASVDVVLSRQVCSRAGREVKSMIEQKDY